MFDMIYDRLNLRVRKGPRFESLRDCLGGFKIATQQIKKRHTLNHQIDLEYRNPLNTLNSDPH